MQCYRCKSVLQQCGAMHLCKTCNEWLRSSHPHPHYRFTKAAPADDVMRDQLDYLIEHASAGDCGCSVCKRYDQAREVLLAPFQKRSATSGGQ